MVHLCSSVKKYNRNKQQTYMKKTYVSPLTVEVSMEAEQMLAASLGVNDDNDNKVDTSIPGNQLGGNHRGEWGNLWQ